MTAEEQIDVHDDKRGVISRPFEGVRFEPSPKWVRVRYGGDYVADSKRAHLLFEPSRLPVYYFPREDVRSDMLERSQRADPSDKGARTYWHVTSGRARAEHAAWTYTEPTDGFSFLAGFVAFRWESMDAWLEEDEEVFVHARDPYHRIDVRRSSRRLHVEHSGVTLAESERASLLFETGLPTRFYIPPTDVRMELLETSEHRTRCPYKGEAEHWSAQLAGALHENIAWTYRLPTVEVAKIEGLVCFYQERVERFYVDGEETSPPETPWSHGE